MTLDTARALILRNVATELKLADEVLAPYRDVHGELPDAIDLPPPSRLEGPVSEYGPFASGWLESAEATLVVLEALRNAEAPMLLTWDGVSALQAAGLLVDYP